MKKILGIFQSITLFSLMLFFPLGCANKNNATTTNSISNIYMSEINTTVTINKEMYEDALIKDNQEAGDFCFLTLLQKTFDDFAKKKDITLSYSTDYKFQLENIDPYSVINKPGKVTILVSASKFTKKITGSFKASVNLISSPKSISQLTLDKQTFNQVKLGVTTFKDVIDSCLPIIESKIKTVDSKAVAFVDYAINFEGRYLTDLITLDDLGVEKVNINAIYNGIDTLLKGSFSFEVELNSLKIY